MVILYSTLGFDWYLLVILLYCYCVLLLLLWLLWNQFTWIWSNLYLTVANYTYLIYWSRLIFLSICQLFSFFLILIYHSHIIFAYILLTRASLFYISFRVFTTIFLLTTYLLYLQTSSFYTATDVHFMTYTTSQ